MRAIATTALVWLLAAAGAAQEPAVDAAARQQAEQAAEAVRQEVVAALHARASALQAEKQYARALQLRQELIQDWAPGDERALAALGFVQIGSIWRRDMNKTVFDRDLSGDKQALKKLDRDWARAHKDLARDVERAAAALAAAGAADAAAVFWRRLLLLRPGDPRAIEQLRLPSFDGHDGTPAELAMLRRGRAFAQGVAFLKEHVPAVTELDGTHPLLQRAGLAHHGARSEHFQVWGNLSMPQLQLAAQWAERALALSRLLFSVPDGRPFEPHRVLNILWTADKPSYQAVLDACADQFDRERLRFLRDDVELAFVESEGAPWRVYALSVGGDEVLLDVTTRGVVQDAANLKAHALWEGIGHATCGILFDRTLSFFVEQQTGNTVTSWKPRPLLPDMATWRQIAAESAWAGNDTPTSRLMLLEGHKFTSEERVKAWAMVDFLLRSRPELLLHLEGSKAPGVNDPLEVEAAFRRRTGLDLGALDDEWRRYWGTGDALRAAMAAPARGADAAVQGARDLVWAIDRARFAAGVPVAGHLLAEGPDTDAAHAWVARLLRHEKDVRKDPKKADLPPPSPPAVVGSTVLVHRGQDASEAVEQWLRRPTVRDYLLAPGRLFFAAHRGRDALVLDLSQPAAPVTAGLPAPWPRDGQMGIAGDVAVADLGPEFTEALAAAGRTAAARVGTPVSLHFHRPIPAEERIHVACRLHTGNLIRDGVLLFAADLDGLAAPGCVVFVPLEPLPSGAEVRVVWSVATAVVDPEQRLGGPVPLREVVFTTR
ncbi:MAG: hypothetical protein AB7O97_18845 [Planctomycetota bacterium]